MNEPLQHTEPDEAVPAGHSGAETLPAQSPSSENKVEEASVGDSPDTEPTLLEQMGGISGLVASTLPVFVFLPVNNAWGLGWAILAALVVAMIVLLWRVLSKANLQPAISAFMAVGLSAGIAWFVGDAKGYFLYGIWASLAFAIAFLISILVRWPLVGVIWNGINGESMAWREVAKSRQAYAIATAAWMVVFIARFLVQENLYAADSTNALWLARMLMGWPLTGVVTLISIVMVRRARKAIEAAEVVNPAKAGA